LISIVKIIYPELGDVDGDGDGYEKNIIYNPRGWVDSMNVKNKTTSVEIFKQEFTRNKIGNIQTQVSKHFGEAPLTQNYTYDAVNRLTNWSTLAGVSESYEYDNIGNRTVKTVNTNEEHTYNYMPGNNSRLSYIDNNSYTTTYDYYQNGQIKSKIKTDNSNLVTSESYSYNNSGQLIEFTKQNIDNVGSSYYSELVQNGNTTLDATKWVWGYKYNYAGQREQKQLLVSPHGDDGTGGTNPKSFAHNWEYYMNGAFGEELIQYTGFQTVKGSGDDVGRRVYLSVNKFNATSELHIRRDGMKEVNFTDNNGQVRVVIDEDNTIVNKYDYKPFGGL
jgi:YD repeat-containing protein